LGLICCVGAVAAAVVVAIALALMKPSAFTIHVDTHNRADFAVLCCAVQYVQ
jgi:hypothetical protein